MNAAKIIKTVFIIAYILLAVEPCILFYEYHFCSGVLHLYEIPDALLCVALISCLWGIESMFLTERLNFDFWVKSALIFIIYIYAL